MRPVLPLQVLAGALLVLVQPRKQAGGDPEWVDTFGSSVQSVSPMAFTVNVARLDKLDNSGWGQVGHSASVTFIEQQG